MNNYIDLFQSLVKELPQEQAVRLRKLLIAMEEYAQQQYTAGYQAGSTAPRPYRDNY